MGTYRKIFTEFCTPARARGILNSTQSLHMYMHYATDVMAGGLEAGVDFKTHTQNF
jgi:hypothetical protein